MSRVHVYLHIHVLMYYIVTMAILHEPTQVTLTGKRETLIQVLAECL